MLVHYNSVNNSIKPGFRNTCVVFYIPISSVVASNPGGGILLRMSGMGGKSKFDLIQHQKCTGGSTRAVGEATLVRF